MSNKFDQESWMNLTIGGLLSDISKCYAGKKQITEELLLSLYTLFPLHSVPALDLIDHQSVTLLTSPSGRRIYSCIGSSETPYLISNTGFICTCPGFRHNLSTTNLWCKHLLALQLSIAMGVIQHREITEDLMITMLSELVMLDD